MPTQNERSPALAAAVLPETGDLVPVRPTTPAPPAAAVLLLGQLLPGARLVVRCRKDWRTAAVAAVAPDVVTLTVCAPSGYTYRLRRSPTAPLACDGAIPLLSDREHTCWRARLARYDARW